MNIHPLVVHFPIAFLMLYAGMEVFRFSFFTKQSWWFYTKAVLVILGVLSGIVVRQTGEAAYEAVSHGLRNPLIEMHDSFSGITIAVFAVLAVCYAGVWYMRDRGSMVQNSYILKLHRVATFVIESPISAFLAIAGFIFLVITAGLGGMIVYGSGVEPVIPWLYSHVLVKIF